MFVFISYCSDMYRTQLLVIFRDIEFFSDVYRLCVTLRGRGSTYVVKIVIKDKILKYLILV